MSGGSAHPPGVILAGVQSQQTRHKGEVRIAMANLDTWGKLRQATKRYAQANNAGDYFKDGKLFDAEYHDHPKQVGNVAYFVESVPAGWYGERLFYVTMINIVGEIYRYPFNANTANLAFPDLSSALSARDGVVRVARAMLVDEKLNAL